MTTDDRVDRDAQVRALAAHLRLTSPVDAEAALFLAGEWVDRGAKIAEGTMPSLQQVLVTNAMHLLAEHFEKAWSGIQSALNSMGTVDKPRRSGRDAQQSPYDVGRKR